MTSQLVAVRAEGIGQDQLRARLDVLAMHFSHRSGIGQVEFIKALVETDAAAVQHRPHGAVGQHDFFVQMHPEILSYS